MAIAFLISVLLVPLHHWLRRIIKAFESFICSCELISQRFSYFVRYDGRLIINWFQQRPVFYLHSSSPSLILYCWLMCCIERQQSPFIFLVYFLNYFFGRTLTYVLSPRPLLSLSFSRKFCLTYRLIYSQADKVIRSQAISKWALLQQMFRSLSYKPAPSKSSIILWS